MKQTRTLSNEPGAVEIALFDALQKVGNATAVNAIQYAADLWETDA